MWQLVNKTRYRAGRVFLRDEQGAEVLVVAIKATFDLSASPSPTAEQAPILVEPVLVDEPGSPLAYESDFCLGKPATDVLLNGTAYAARGAPTVAMETILAVGPIDKRIAIVGDRRWQRRAGGPALGEPEPFTTIELGWKRAYGGSDDEETEARNPAGTGFAKNEESLVGKLAPNQLAAGALAPAPLERLEPAGFGPIARAWQPRLGFAGTFDDAWTTTRSPLLPLDYDRRHEQCAPLDQQVAGYLKGGETIALGGLTPSGTLQTTVPRVLLSVRAMFSRSAERLEPVLQTLLLEPDAGRMVLTFQATMPCHRSLYDLRRIVVRERRHD
jgi:hypothetical protein